MYRTYPTPIFEVLTPGEWSGLVQYTSAGVVKCESLPVSISPPAPTVLAVDPDDPYGASYTLGEERTSYLLHVDDFPTWFPPDPALQAIYKSCTQEESTSIHISTNILTASASFDPDPIAAAIFASVPPTAVQSANDPPRLLSPRQDPAPHLLPYPAQAAYLSIETDLFGQR